MTSQAVYQHTACDETIKGLMAQIAEIRSLLTSGPVGKVSGKRYVRADLPRHARVPGVRRQPASPVHLQPVRKEGLANG